MEIKRTTEIFVETKKRLVFLRPENAGQILCSTEAGVLLVCPGWIGGRLQQSE
jgi:hypothetical protein